MKRIKPTTKRKIAGVVAVVLVAAIVLSAILPLFMGTIYAAEQQQFTIEAQVGFDGDLKIEQNSPINIKITNNSDKDFKGKVLIDGVSGFNMIENSYDEESSVEYFSDIELAAGETKEINGKFFVSTIENEYEIKLVDKKNNFITALQVPVNTTSENTGWLGIMSDSTTAKQKVGENFSALKFYNIDSTVNVERSNLNVLNSLSMLIIDNYEMSNLTDTELANLNSWVNNGGVLILSGEHSNYTEQQWFKSLTNGNSGFINYDNYSAIIQLRNAIASLSDSYLNDYYTTDELVELSKELDYNYLSMLTQLLAYCGANQYNSRIDIYELSEQIIEANNITEVKKYIDDTYRICTYDTEFDNYKFSVYTDKNAINNISTVILGNGYIYVASDIEAVMNYLNTGIIEYPNIQQNANYNYYPYNLLRPKDILGSVFLAIIMLYAIFIGPFLYIILNKMDKKEMAVKYIPASSVILSCIIILFSIGSKFQKPIGTTVNLVCADGGGVKNVNGFVSCSAPVKGELEIENEKLTDFSICNNYYRYDADSFKVSLDKFDYIIEDVQKWETYEFTYSDSIEINGGLDIVVTDISQNFQQATVTVTNNTGYDLKDICVFTDENKIYAAKDLRNGETIEVDYRYFNSVNNNISIARKFEKMNENKKDVIYELSNDNIKVVGFSDNDLSGEFRMNGKKIRKEELIAFYNESPEFELSNFSDIAFQQTNNANVAAAFEEMYNSSNEPVTAENNADVILMEQATMAYMGEVQ